MKSRRFKNLPYDVRLPSTNVKDVHAAIKYLINQSYNYGEDFNVNFHDGVAGYTTFSFFTQSFATEFVLRFL